MNFSEFKLNRWLLQWITDMWYSDATEIQSKVIIAALEWKNIVWQSQTWTWKTAAFLIPLLEKIAQNRKWLQLLILAPTRELVNQIWEEIEQLTVHNRIHFACIYWGASSFMQKRKLLTWPTIIVATPWRLKDFMNQWVIDISKVKYFILDEVDRMLDMWFVRDIKKIRSLMPSIQQTMTFSATISPEIKKIIDEKVPNYEFIKIWEEVTVDKIKHYIMRMDHTDKLINLIKLIEDKKNDKIVVFTQTKRNTNILCSAIQEYFEDVWALNWDMSQWKRNATLKFFKDWLLRILVTTDVASRWLNMENVNLVINFDVPKEAESYIHRIWRTWRAWADWQALMFVCNEEKPLVNAIEKMHRITIRESNYEVVTDDKRLFTNLRLDKSTDKFWKWNPNPNKQRKSKSSSDKFSSKPLWSSWSRSSERKSFGSRSSERSPSREWISFSSEWRGWERKSFGGRRSDRSPSREWRSYSSEWRSWERRSFGGRRSDKSPSREWRSYSSEWRSWERKSFGGKGWDKKSSSKSPIVNKKSFRPKRSFR